MHQRTAKFIKKIILTAYLFLLPTAFAACTITVPGVNKTITLPSISLPFKLPFFGGGEPSGPIELTYWGLWESPEVMQGLIEEYQSKHPNVTINYEMRDPKDYFETVRARITTDLAPDIVRVHASWVPFLKKDLSPIPTDVMDNTTYEATFYPITKETLFFDNRYYGLPLEVDGLALIYNRDLLTQAGITTPPATWDKLREYARTLTKKDTQGQVVQAGAALGFAKNIVHFSDILGLMFAQNGVTFMDREGKVVFHESLSPDGRNLGAEALQFYALFGGSELAWNPLWENSILAFANGKVAMIFAPSFRILGIANKNPRLNLGVAPAPQLPGAESQVNWGSYWVEAVSKNTKYSKEAWKFLKFLTEKESEVAMFKTASQLRLFGEPYSRVDLADTLLSDRYLSSYISQASTYTTWFLADATHDNVLNDRIIKILQEAVENVAAGGDAASALKRAGPGVQKVLDELK